ncbi:hypothetical protein FGG08_006835 [Glutinoglossum americanum]|uniref:Neutral ceramidase n=1 Tax=Glutinoglossum americanum TaxID=1670608 RepID=A0A9P8L0K7_9PEZI|nr:hypothetical protein FGG08_006835 [Glutinoglossum americanum]
MNSISQWNGWLRWQGGSSWRAPTRARGEDAENASLKRQSDFSDEEIMLRKLNSTAGYDNRPLFGYYYRPEQPRLGKWSRYRRAIVVATACLVFLVLRPLSLMIGPSGWGISNIGIFGGSGSCTGALCAADPDEFLIGVGKADITGPVVELNLMGYANTAQTGTGLRQRLYSRAFIIGSVDNPQDRFVYVVLDAQSSDTNIRYGILSGLAELSSEYSVYGQKNVAVTGTHNHAGPGAWANYLLLQITSLGFDKQSYRAIVDGAVLSIKRAHESLTPGHLTFGYTKIDDANINRSPSAYLANPAAERARYSTDVDKDMTLLRFQRASDKKNIGVLTWFPVHGTSLLGNNTIVAADNKGVAAWLFEQSVGDGIVAGFSQSNVGDSSPNIKGAWCEDGSGSPCSFEQSLCGGKASPCHGQGPFTAQFDNGAKSCFEIGRRQFSGALKIYNSLDATGMPLRGGVVRYAHSSQDMSNFAFTHPNGTPVSTCPAALGYSFAAGTTDGPGPFDFTQGQSGNPTSNPLWGLVGGALKDPSPEQRACHAPKPILLDVGEITWPYLWSPNIVDVQLLRAGQMIFIIGPGEVTTMSGRRWKEAIADAAAANPQVIDVGLSPLVVLGGPGNTYTHYIATEEEYGVQRYEGASTLYGPHTLNAYINLTVTYVSHLSSAARSSPPAGPLPPNNVDVSLSFIPGVVYDNPPIGKSFGQVLKDVSHATPYHRGDVVSATFQGANPRNNLRLEGTYAAVEKKLDDRWFVERDDADWSLLYQWRKVDGLLGTSEVTLTWEIDENADPGTYRFRYYGDAKQPFTGKINAFVGTSNTFTIV